MSLSLSVEAWSGAAVDLGPVVAGGGGGGVGDLSDGETPPGPLEPGPSGTAAGPQGTFVMTTCGMRQVYVTGTTFSTHRGTWIVFCSATIRQVCTGTCSTFSSETILQVVTGTRRVISWGTMWHTWNETFFSTRSTTGL